MLNTVLISCAVGLYSLATILIAKALRTNTTSPKSDAINTAPRQITTAFVIGAIANALHLWLASRHSVIDEHLDFSLGSMTILISGLLGLIFILGGLGLPVRRLGIIVFPMTILSVLFGWYWGGEKNIMPSWSTAASVHIVVSILAYCLLAIATVQALIYTYQERQFKRRVTPAMLVALPPLQTMEQLLFRLIWTGFALLSLTLLSGAAFSSEIYNRPFEFKHHTILAMLGWLVFAILLSLRVLNGIRGSQAVSWTIAGFLLIQLGYFGTKFVTEVLAVQ